jgi:hypothetical protein
MRKTSDDHEIYVAVRHILSQLPKELCGRWMELHQLHTQVKRGGFPLLPFDVFRLAVKGSRDCMKRDRFGGKRYYMFGDMVTLEMAPNCYKDQRDIVAVVNDRLNVGYFLRVARRSDQLQKHVKVLEDAGYTGSGGDKRPSQQANIVSTPTQQHNKEASSSEKEGEESQKSQQSQETTMSQSSDSVNFRIVEDETDDNFLALFAKHSRNCDGDLLLVDDQKMGFDSLRKYECKACCKCIKRRASRDVNSDAGHRGRPKSLINTTMATSLLEAGIGVSKANDCWARAGINSPTLRIAQKARDLVLESAEIVYGIENGFLPNFIDWHFIQTIR